MKTPKINWKNIALNIFIFIAAVAILQIVGRIRYDDGVYDTLDYVLEQIDEKCHDSTITVLEIHTKTDTNYFLLSRDKVVQHGSEVKPKRIRYGSIN